MPKKKHTFGSRKATTHKSITAWQTMCVELWRTFGVPSFVGRRKYLPGPAEALRPVLI